MVATKFSVGDVVRLISGGPKMTILDAQALSASIPAAYKAGWFDKGRIIAANFPEGALKKVRGQ